MKRVIGWLKSIFTQQANLVVDDPAHDLPDDHAVDVPSSAEVAAWMEDHEPVEQECAATVPSLNILDTGSAEIRESTGIDPYDTAQFFKK